MKQLLLILCMGLTVNSSFAQESAPQQSIMDSHHNVLAYIKAGVVTNASNQFIGAFKPVNGEQKIVDKNHNVIGYLTEGKNIKDAQHKLLGSFVSDGKTTNTISVLDANNNKIGSINFETGAVTDKMVNLIGYEINTEVMWAAPYFFFFKFQ